MSVRLEDELIHSLLPSLHLFRHRKLLVPTPGGPLWTATLPEVGIVVSLLLLFLISISMLSSLYLVFLLLGARRSLEVKLQEVPNTEKIVLRKTREPISFL